MGRWRVGRYGSLEDVRVSTKAVTTKGSREVLSEWAKRDRKANKGTDTE